MLEADLSIFVYFYPKSLFFLRLKLKSMLEMSKIFDNFGIKKVVFLIFSRFFMIWFGIVRALFLDLKDLLKGIFSARKVNNWPQKLRIYVKFCTSGRVILDHYSGHKSHFLDFFKVICEFFMSCLRIIFGLQRPTLGISSARKIDKYTRKYKCLIIFTSDRVVFK